MKFSVFYILLQGQNSKMDQKKEVDRDRGEVNLGFQVSETDPQDPDWPSFKEKLARFNSRFASVNVDKPDPANEHQKIDDAKDASSPSINSSGHKSAASPSLSMASITSIPSSTGINGTTTVS
jgi:hypothetical protein